MKKKVLIPLICLVLLLGGAVGYTVSRGITPEEAEAISDSKAAENRPQASVISEEEAGKANASITLSQNSSESDSSKVRIDNSTNIITISYPGTYRLSGTLEEGQIKINTSSKEAVILVLDGVSVTNSQEAALLVENSHDLTLYLQAGTENVFTSGQETEITLAASDDAATGGAITLKDDATICGSGSLTVKGYVNNGIHCSNNLFIESGTLSVTAVNNGIKGKDSLTIDGGDITILSGNDGLKSDDTTGEGCGVVTLNDGTLNIESFQDAVQTETILTVNGGTLT